MNTGFLLFFCFLIFIFCVDWYLFITNYCALFECDITLV